MSSIIKHVVYFMLSLLVFRVETFLLAQKELPSNLAVLKQNNVNSTLHLLIYVFTGFQQENFSAEPVVFINYTYFNRENSLLSSVAFCNYLYSNRVTTMFHPVAFCNYLFSNRVTAIFHPVAFLQFYFTNRVSSIIYSVVFCNSGFPTE